MAAMCYLIIQSGQAGGTTPKASGHDIPSGRHMQIHPGRETGMLGGGEHGWIGAGATKQGRAPTSNWIKWEPKNKEWSFRLGPWAAFTGLSVQC